MNTMYYIKSIVKIKLIIIALLLEGIQCSIDGSFSKPIPNNTKTGENPCNPLYWYPKNIPQHCYIKTSPSPMFPDLPPVPVPIPVPLPVPPPPIMPPLVMPSPPMPPGPLPPIMVPQPIMPLPIPLPYGIPLAPTNPMAPVAGFPLRPPPPPPPAYPMPYPPAYPMPYPPYPGPIAGQYPPLPPPYPSSYPSPYPMPPRKTIGMVPGIEGLVSPDGGINIMPFSDVYADMLENHKQKMIRRQLEKFIHKYDSHPWKSRRKTRRYNEKEEENLDDNTLG